MNIVYILLTLYLIVVNGANDYCKICSNHIACNNNGKINETCKAKSTLIDMSADDVKNIILKEHNEKRNEIALGNIDGMEKSSRMATMQWDNELAKLAELNVKTCIFKHDKCRNTKKYEYSGQNIGYWTGYPAISVEDAILLFIKSWFDEYKDADMSMINEYHKTDKTIGHFTVMVADRNTEVGCGMLKTVNGKTTTYVFTCNYATTNVIGEPIYISGETGSACTTGVNPNFPGLCSVDENIDANMFYA